MVRQALREAGAVGIEALRPAFEEVERCLGGVLRAEEALEHAVAGDGIDEAGGVADEQRAGPAPSSSPARGAATGSRAAPRVVEGCAVRLAEPAEVRAQARPSSSQPPTPKFAWSPLGKTQP
jgi:hypothetical protein